MNQNNHHMHFVISEAQYRRLSEDAKQCRLSKRKYLIKLIEGAEIKARPTEELKKLRAEVHYIGNNINQVTRKINAGFGTEEDLKLLIALMEQVYRQMYEVAKE